MALTTAAAILGSAAVGALASSSASSKAAKTAAKASQNATDATTALQREALATQQANTAKAREGGDAAITQLMSRLGLNQTASGAASTATATSTGTAATATAPTTDWKSYIANNPDVAAAVNDPNYGFTGSTPEQRAADQYARYGQAEGRALPTTAPAATAPAATTPAAPATSPQTAQTSANDVQLSGAASVPTYTRPTTTTQAPTYTPTTITPQNYVRPEYGQTLDVSLDKYVPSPDYQWQVAEGDRAVKANAAATIGLNSGAAIKALQDRRQNLAMGDYGQWRDYTTGQFNTDRNRYDSNYNFDTSLNSNNVNTANALNTQNQQFGANYNQNAYQYDTNRTDNVFNQDRAYGTDLALNNRNFEAGRYDNTTNALFSLANLGQGAASNYGQAVQNSANNTSNALFSNAGNQGNAALTQANNFSNLLGTGANALAYYYGNKPSTTASTLPNAYAQGGGY